MEELNIKDYINDVNKYHAKMVDKHNIGSTEFDKILQRVHCVDRVTELNQAGHQGIDGVYCNPGPPPKYIIGEAKYGTSQLSALADGTKQMSNEWIYNGTKLKDAVGRDAAKNIIKTKMLNPNSVERELVHIEPNGTVSVKTIE